MKPPIVLLVILLFFNSVRAQSPKLDSLNRLISRATSDTARINLNNAKIEIWRENNLDSAIRLGLQTIESAKRIQYRRGEAVARLRLAASYNFKGNFAAAGENLKQAETTLAALQDSAFLIKVYNTYGMLYGMQSKYDSAITFLQKAIAVAEGSSYKADLGNLYLNLGISYDMLSNRPQALLYQQKALNLAEVKKDLKGQAYVLVNMANIYKVMDDRKGAIQRYLKAIKITRQEGIKNVELYAYTNLAAIYTEMKENQKAYEVAMKAAGLGKEMGDEGIQSTSLSRAALNLAFQKKFAEADKLNRQAMTIADRSGQPLIVHQTYGVMGSILRMQARYAAAIPYYEKSFAVLKDADIYAAETGVNYAELSECYEKTGNYRQALAAYKTSAAIGDSVQGKENVRKATELTMTFDFDKKQQAAQAEQQRLNAIQDARQLTLLAGLVLMLLLAGVSFYAFRTKQKANVLLEEQKKQLQDQKGQLEEQKQQLQNTLTELKSTQRQLLQAEKMATMGKLTKGIVDRILNPLNYINNFSLASRELLGELTAVTDKHQTGFSPEDRDDLNDTALMLGQNLEKINHHGSSTARILQDMQKLLKERTSAFAVLDVNQFLENQLRTSLDSVLARYSPSLPVQLHFSLADQPLEVNLLPFEFCEVLSSMVDNSVYSLCEKSRLAADFVPTIEVGTQLIHDHVHIRFRDNGKGIPATELPQLFSPFFTTKPTAKGTGLGLYMSRDVVEYLQGQMSIESTEGEFTQVTIILPLATTESLV